MSFQWLNNCVGRKNYMTFVLLMASSLVWVCALVVSAASHLPLRIYKTFWHPIYFSFLHISQLAIEAGVGVAVFVRCFVSKESMEAEIVNRLGDSFSRPPFAAVVVCCY